MPVRDFFDNLYKVIVIVVEYKAVFVLKMKISFIFLKNVFTQNKRLFLYLQYCKYCLLNCKNIVKEKKCKVFYMH